MKKRLDTLLVERGLAGGRDKAKALIMEGIVYIGGEKAIKPGDEHSPDAEIEIRGKTLPYVSRGGLKLEKALGVFELEPKGTVCADIGASTGGFTDCLLQNGAAKVYAVDVGYGQLAWALRSDSRVVVLERTNARYLTTEQIPEPLDLITIDASFISLTLLLPAVSPLLKEGGQLLCLIKPQFEAGKEKVGKNGVVRDTAVHAQVIEKVADFANNIGLDAIGLDYSPIKGPKGNVEYLLCLQKNCKGITLDSEKIQEVIDSAAANLEGKG
ncbi:MAG: TlyA family RNA methyltransferase [Oscillospiraceae bacterium]|nr:TlyA family RNA methyltransferase [Oscillospiraceae bacterium]